MDRTDKIKSIIHACIERELRSRPGLFGGRLRKYQRLHASGFTAWAALYDVDPQLSRIYEAVWHVCGEKLLPGGFMTTLDSATQATFVEQCITILNAVDAEVWFQQLTPDEMEARAGEGFAG